MGANRVRIGVLGCAKIAQRSVIPSILRLPELFELVAVASRDKDKAYDFSRQFSCESVQGYEKLISRVDIDALYIPLPTGLHGKWVRMAIDAGKHCYVEKPFAKSLRETKELVSLSESKGVAVFEGYMFLYHGQLKKISSILSSGLLGGIKYIYSCFGFPPLPKDDFRYDPMIGGGALMDAAGYPARLIRYLLGPSAVISSSSLHRSECGVVLGGSAFYKTASAVTATAVFGFDQQYQCSLEILCSKGRIRADRVFTARPEHSAELIIDVGSDTQVLKGLHDDHFLNAMAEFYTLIKSPQKRKLEVENIISQSADLDSILRMSEI